MCSMQSQSISPKMVASPYAAASGNSMYQAGNANMMSTQYHRVQLAKLVRIIADPKIAFWVARHEEQILSIAVSSPATGNVLQWQCLELEKQVRERSRNLAQAGYTVNSDWFENRNFTQLQSESTQYAARDRMLECVASLVPEQEQQANAITIEAGPPKTMAGMKRLRNVEAQPELLKFVHDLIRCRGICADVRTLERIVAVICGRLFPGPHDITTRTEYPRIVRFMNYYAPNVPRRHGEFYRGVHITIALDDDWCFEWQLVTENLHIVSFLDHPFMIAKTRAFPDNETRDWAVPKK